MATAAAALGSGGSGSTGRLVGCSSGGDPLAAALTPAQRWYLQALHLELRLWDILAVGDGAGHGGGGGRPWRGQRLGGAGSSSAAGDDTARGAEVGPLSAPKCSF
jgi:hypothetical protein